MRGDYHGRMYEGSDDFIDLVDTPPMAKQAAVGTMYYFSEEAESIERILGGFDPERIPADRMVRETTVPSVGGAPTGGNIYIENPQTGELIGMVRKTNLDKASSRKTAQGDNQAIAREFGEWLRSTGESNPTDNTLNAWLDINHPDKVGERADIWEAYTMGLSSGFGDSAFEGIFSRKASSRKTGQVEFGEGESQVELVVVNNSGTLDENAIFDEIANLISAVEPGEEGRAQIEAVIRDYVETRPELSFRGEGNKFFIEGAKHAGVMVADEERIMEAIGQGGMTSNELASILGWSAEELEGTLQGMEQGGYVSQQDGLWMPAGEWEDVDVGGEAGTAYGPSMEPEPGSEYYQQVDWRGGAKTAQEDFQVGDMVYVNPAFVVNTPSSQELVSQPARITKFVHVTPGYDSPGGEAADLEWDNGQFMQGVELRRLKKVEGWMIGKTAQGSGVPSDRDDPNWLEGYEEGKRDYERGGIQQGLSQSDLIDGKGSMRDNGYWHGWIDAAGRAEGRMGAKTAKSVAEMSPSEAQKRLDSMGGSVSTCIDAMTGKVDDAGAYCASLQDKATGSTDWRGKESGLKAKTAAGDYWRDPRGTQYFIGDDPQGWYIVAIDEPSAPTLFGPSTQDDVMTLARQMGLKPQREAKRADRSGGMSDEEYDRFQAGWSDISGDPSQWTDERFDQYVEEWKAQGGSDPGDMSWMKPSATPPGAIPSRYQGAKTAVNDETGQPLAAGDRVKAYDNTEGTIDSIDEQTGEVILTTDYSNSKYGPYSANQVRKMGKLASVETDDLSDAMEFMSDAGYSLELMPDNTVVVNGLDTLSAEQFVELAKKQGFASMYEGLQGYGHRKTAVTDEDWKLINDYLYHSGDKVGRLSDYDVTTLYGMADGYGHLTTNDLVERDLVWDWSHIRDSSDEALQRIADQLRSVDKTAQVEGWGTSVEEASQAILEQIHPRSGFSGDPGPVIEQVSQQYGLSDQEKQQVITEINEYLQAFTGSVTSKQIKCAGLVEDFKASRWGGGTGSSVGAGELTVRDRILGFLQESYPGEDHETLGSQIAAALGPMAETDWKQAAQDWEMAGPDLSKPTPMLAPDPVEEAEEEGLFDEEPTPEPPQSDEDGAGEENGLEEEAGVGGDWTEKTRLWSSKHALYEHDPEPGDEVMPADGTPGEGVWHVITEVVQKGGPSIGDPNPVVRAKPKDGGSEIEFEMIPGGDPGGVRGFSGKWGAKTAEDWFPPESDEFMQRMQEAGPGPGDRVRLRDGTETEWSDEVHDQIESWMPDMGPQQWFAVQGAKTAQVQSIEDFRGYWRNQQELNPAKGIMTAMSEYSEDKGLSDDEEQALHNAVMGVLPSFTAQYEDDLYGDEPVECPACGGPGEPLGQLGNRSHYRCQNCGMDFSDEVSREGARKIAQAYWDVEPTPEEDENEHDLWQDPDFLYDTDVEMRDEREGAKKTAEDFDFSQFFDPSHPDYDEPTGMPDVGQAQLDKALEEAEQKVNSGSRPGPAISDAAQDYSVDKAELRRLYEERHPGLSEYDMWGPGGGREAMLFGKAAGSYEFDEEKVERDEDGKFVKNDNPLPDKETA